MACQTEAPKMDNRRRGAGSPGALSSKMDKEGAQGSPRNGQPVEEGKLVQCTEPYARQGRKRWEAPEMDNPGAIHASIEPR